MNKSAAITVPRKDRTICIHFCQAEYNLFIFNPEYFRTILENERYKHPELFPSEIQFGYMMKDIRKSIKLKIYIRRITIKGCIYSVRPSFVMPYMTGFTRNVEKPLFLRKFAVPFWAISHCFGRNAMYWYRLEVSLGRNSLVGTTIKAPENLPINLVADEKHTRLLGNKTYIATVAGNGCVLGAEVAESASQEKLEKAYEVFKKESELVDPEYKPDTVNTDGWIPTQNAWKSLFPSITLIACFLHIFIGIRDRSKRKFKDIFQDVATKLWDCYDGESRASFSQRVRRLHEWCISTKVPPIILEKIEKIRGNLAQFTIAYDFPGSHRTSNMIDRLMQRMDRHLFSTQYFHGTLASATLSIRAWALIQNFAPFNPQTIKKHDGVMSPAEKANNFRYHENWLHNLLISASLRKARAAPQNPL